MEVETVKPRDGEDLDTEQVRLFLLAAVGLKAQRVEIKQFPAGSSNLTYLISAGDIEFVLRRPPFGNTVKSAHDMRREYEVLSKLNAVFPLAPRPVLFCDDAGVLGCEFYLMERRRGLVVRGEAPKELSESSALQKNVVRGFINCLAELHSVDFQAAGLSELGKPDGYVRRQVEGWTKRYFAAKTHEWPELEAAIAWLHSNIPVEYGASIIHNDYKFDNVMLNPDDLAQITAVLDWEMVTVGDPLMDLGTTLGYWMSKDTGDGLLNMPFNPRTLMENISRRDLVEMYSAAAGRQLPDMLFYYIFGTFKIAVIAQQIYARFVKGFTKDPRFTRFDSFVDALGRIAASSLDRNSI